MEAITEAGVSIYAHNLGLETLLANAKRNPVAGIVIAVMIEPGGRCHRRYGNGTVISRVAGTSGSYPAWPKHVVVASS